MIQLAGILVIQAGKFVLQERDDKPTIADPGMFSIWGGAAEGDETPAQAAIRELEEETGVKVALSDLKYLSDVVTGGKSPASFGKMVRASIFFVELPKTVTVQCFEGKGLKKVKSLDEVPEAKRTEFLVKAIETYEQRGQVVVVKGARDRSTFVKAKGV